MEISTDYVRRRLLAINESSATMTSACVVDAATRVPRADEALNKIDISRAGEQAGYHSLLGNVLNLLGKVTF